MVSTDLIFMFPLSSHHFTSFQYFSLIKPTQTWGPTNPPPFSLHKLFPRGGTVPARSLTFMLIKSISDLIRGWNNVTVWPLSSASVSLLRVPPLKSLVQTVNITQMCRNGTSTRMQTATVKVDFVLLSGCQEVLPWICGKMRKIECKHGDEDVANRRSLEFFQTLSWSKTSPSFTQCSTLGSDVGCTDRDWIENRMPGSLSVPFHIFSGGTRLSPRCPISECE